MTIDNYGMRIYRRFKTHIGLTYDSDPDILRAFLAGIRELIIRNPRTCKDFYGANLHEFGASGLNVLLYIYFEVKTTQEEWEAREEMMIDILDLAHLLELRIAFPTHTIHKEISPDIPNLAQTAHLEVSPNLAKKIATYIDGKFLGDVNK